MRGLVRGILHLEKRTKTAKNLRPVVFVRSAIIFFCLPHIDIKNIVILALPTRRLLALELMLKLSDFDSVPAFLIIWV